jgi:serine phosphatase RsbU (regulator of sigma subunit)
MGDDPAVSSSGGDRRLPFRTSSVVVLLLLVLVTLAGSWETRTIVHDQEHRLLRERTAEVGLLLSSALSAVPATLNVQGQILRDTHGSASAYKRSAAATVAAGPGQLTFAWLRAQSQGRSYVVLAAVGAGLRTGEVVADARVRAFAKAIKARSFAATPVMGSDRRLGFAVGPPTAPAGTVLYRESALGPVSPPRQAASSPFAELDVVLYGAPTVQPAQVLTSTTGQFPLTGDVRNQPLAAGASHWLLSVKARRPLVGSATADAPWFVLGAGLLGSLLVAAIVEAAGRRRDDALALYESEHQVAETLQRSLLPQLPIIPGLELAARYLAAGSGQEVGGDWFDAFPLAGGRVGLAIGDVIGHDLRAASAMAQVRAALRAYAVDGDPPATVINRLDHLVDTFDLTQLVTVIYAVLEPVEADGSRLMRYANAGHLPPLILAPDGEVSTLTSGASVVIGAPITIEHGQAEHRLESGTTLLLFTDGLVEVPGRSLQETLAELAVAVAGSGDDVGVEAMCERIVATAADRSLRDDIALLAVRIMTSQWMTEGIAEPHALHEEAPGLHSTS